MHELKPGQKWWNNVGKVVGEYNKEHVSRSTQMTPNEAARASDRDVVKTKLRVNPQE